MVFCVCTCLPPFLFLFSIPFWFLLCLNRQSYSQVSCLVQKMFLICKRVHACTESLSLPSSLFPVSPLLQPRIPFLSVFSDIYIYIYIYIYIFIYFLLFFSFFFFDFVDFYSSFLLPQSGRPSTFQHSRAVRPGCAHGGGGGGGGGPSTSRLGLCSTP